MAEVNGNKTARKKCGSKSASAELTATVEPGDIARIVQNNYKWFKYPIVKSDEECAERLDMFFRTCSSMDNLPTVEKMSLALGTVRGVVWKWEHGDGCSKQRSDMIKKAKEILAAIDAELVANGRIPVVSYIFRAKNFFGMKDQQEVTFQANNPLGDEPSEDRIAATITALPDAGNE